MLRAKGIGKGSITIRVTEQDSALFKAEKSWETPGTAGHVGGKEVEKVDFDGKGVHLAEHGANGLYVGRHAAPDTLELVLSRPAMAPPTARN